MIGVVARASDSAAVREFFELFKTPWEFYVAGSQYDVVISTGQEAVLPADCGVVLVYDNTGGNGGGRAPGVRRLIAWGDEIPIYCGLACFPESGEKVADLDSGQPAMQRKTDGRRQVLTIGYDLFAEIRVLLTRGQPPEYAAQPTIDLHIELLRKLIVGTGARLVEIRPTPKGHALMACLTHDVDHPSIRLHPLDHTILGFLHRATLGSILNFLRGRLSLGGLLSNFSAVIKLPLVKLGLVKDFWRDLASYVRLEHEAPSTFFVIPFKGKAGLSGGEKHSGRRAARYGISEIAGQIEELQAAGCEIGVHGIDGWADAEAGKSEADEVRRVTGLAPSGIRMHWLYFDENSALKLEEAGFEYDSTIGYNETVGFRAGTAQVFRPLTVHHLLELPLHVMDTALFYPSYLNLSPREAAAVVGRLIELASRLGGCLTINWHDRSIAPERQWGGFYSQLLADLKARGALFTNASTAVSWFRKRRMVSFQRVIWEDDSVRVALRGEAPAGGIEYDVRVWQNGSEINRVEVEFEPAEVTGDWARSGTAAGYRMSG